MKAAAQPSSRSRQASAKARVTCAPANNLYLTAIPSAGGELERTWRLSFLCPLRDQFTDFGGNRGKRITCLGEGGIGPVRQPVRYTVAQARQHYDGEGGIDGSDAVDQGLA